ncbi:glutathione S-transferase family protein [Gammaproteobacteria bacterium]|nr:glutathione S-transferase family protein [Gammaproteobacteria bacterium]
MAITLYHCPRSRSVRPLWALEEMGLEYELITMDFPPRQTYPGYLAINNLGTVPTLIDGDVTLTESSAMTLYLAEKYGPTTLTLAPSEPDYGFFLNWLHRSDATLTFPLTLVLRYTQHEPVERQNPQVVEDYTKWFFARLRSVEAALADRDYLCGDRFTLADICVGYSLVFAESLGLAAGFKERTQAYLKRLKAREGFARAYASREDA